LIGLPVRAFCPQEERIAEPKVGTARGRVFNALAQRAETGDRWKHADGVLYAKPANAPVIPIFEQTGLWFLSDEDLQGYCGQRTARDEEQMLVAKEVFKPAEQRFVKPVGPARIEGQRLAESVILKRIFNAEKRGAGRVLPCPRTGIVETAAQCLH